MGSEKDIGPWEGEGEGAVATETERKVKAPRLYKVLLHNDNYTTMDFVVMVLMTVFRLPESEAIRIMLHVHHKGVGVAGVFPFEIAETKAQKTMAMARAHEFPLRASVEPA